MRALESSSNKESQTVQVLRSLNRSIVSYVGHYMLVGVQVTRKQPIVRPRNLGLSVGAAEPVLRTFPNYDNHVYTIAHRPAFQMMTNQCI